MDVFAIVIREYRGYSGTFAILTYQVQQLSCFWIRLAPRIFTKQIWRSR